MCRIWLPEQPFAPSQPWDKSAVPKERPIRFSSDETLAAGLAQQSAIAGCASGLVIFEVTALQPSVRIAPLQEVRDFAWLPGAHTLLVLARDALLLLDADASPPALLLSAELPDCPACLDLMPSGRAAVVLDCDQDSERTLASLGFYDTASLERLDEPDSFMWALDEPELPSAVHASSLCIAACIGSHVWLHFFGDEPWTPGEGMTYLHGLTGASLSPCGRLLTGAPLQPSQDEPREVPVIDVRSGPTLWAVPNIPLIRPEASALPLSAAWAGPDRCQLHVGSQGPRMWEDTIAFRVFSVQGGCN